MKFLSLQNYTSNTAGLILCKRARWTHLGLPNLLLDALPAASPSHLPPGWVSHKKCSGWAPPMPRKCQITCMPVVKLLSLLPYLITCHHRRLYVIKKYVWYEMELTHQSQLNLCRKTQSASSLQTGYRMIWSKCQSARHQVLIRKPNQPSDHFKVMFTENDQSPQARAHPALTGKSCAYYIQVNLQDGRHPGSH